MGEDANGSGRRPKTLILDVYGRYSPQFHGWLAVSNLVHLMGLLGVDEQAVRSALSRMSRRGLLHKEVRDGVRGYATTAAADDLLADGDRRIYASMDAAPLSEGWVLVSFSIPEAERDKRHLLRSKLMWLGMGNVGSALWIAPRRSLDLVTESVATLGLTDLVDVFTAQYQGFDEATELVRRAWDLEALEGQYQQFLDDHGPLEERLARRRRPVDGAEAFGWYTLALHDWRKFPYLDPGLPAELLARNWPGRRAADLFGRLRARLEPTAFSYAASLVGDTRHVRS